jgi:hypothetical protein
VSAWPLLNRLAVHALPASWALAHSAVMVAVPDTVAVPRAFLTATGSGLPRDGLHNGNVNHQQTEKEERLYCDYN